MAMPERGPARKSGRRPRVRRGSRDSTSGGGGARRTPSIGSRGGSPSRRGGSSSPGPSGRRMRGRSFRGGTMAMVALRGGAARRFRAKSSSIIRISSRLSARFCSRVQRQDHREGRLRTSASGACPRREVHAATILLLGNEHLTRLRSQRRGVRYDI